MTQQSVMIGFLVTRVNRETASHALHSTTATTQFRLFVQTCRAILKEFTVDLTGILF